MHPQGCPDCSVVTFFFNHFELINISLTFICVSLINMRASSERVTCFWCSCSALGDIQILPSQLQCNDLVLVRGVCLKGSMICEILPSPCVTSARMGLSKSMPSHYDSKKVGEGEGEPKEFTLRWFLGTFMEETQCKIGFCDKSCTWGLGVMVTCPSLGVGG